MPLAEIEDCVAEQSDELGLQYCGEEPMSIVVEIAQAAKAKQLEKVTTIDLGGNALDVAAIEALGDMALPHLPQLTELDMRHNELGLDGVVALRKVAGKQNRALRTLVLAENKLGDAGSREALLLLLDLPALESLALGSNGLTPQLGPMIGKAVVNQSRRCLKVLSLEFNALGDVGVTALCRALLEARTALENLNLSDNCVGDDGVISGLVPLLRSSKQQIAILDLSVNKIGAKGAVGLASVMATTATLRSIDVGCNPIATEGAKAIATAVRTPSAIAALDLTSAGLTPDVMQLLIEAATHNRRLCAVSTGNNDEVPLEMHHELLRLLKEGRDTTPFAGGPTACRGAAASSRWLVAAVAVAAFALGAAAVARNQRR